MGTDFFGSGSEGLEKWLFSHSGRVYLDVVCYD